MIKRSWRAQPVSIRELIAERGSQTAAELLGCSAGAMGKWLRSNDCPKMAEIAAKALLRKSKARQYLVSAKGEQAQAFKQFCTALQLELKEI